MILWGDILDKKQGVAGLLKCIRNGNGNTNLELWIKFLFRFYQSYSANVLWLLFARGNEEVVNYILHLESSIAQFSFAHGHMHAPSLPCGLYLLFCYKVLCNRAARLLLKNKSYELRKLSVSVSFIASNWKHVLKKNNLQKVVHILIYLLLMKNFVE